MDFGVFHHMLSSMPKGEIVEIRGTLSTLWEIVKKGEILDW